MFKFFKHFLNFFITIIITIIIIIWKTVRDFHLLVHSAKCLQQPGWAMVGARDSVLVPTGGEDVRAPATHCHLPLPPGVHRRQEARMENWARIQTQPFVHAIYVSQTASWLATFIICSSFIFLRGWSIYFSRGWSLYIQRNLHKSSFFNLPKLGSSLLPCLLLQSTYVLRITVSYFVVHAYLLKSTCWDKHSSLLHPCWSIRSGMWWVIPVHFFFLLTIK